MPSKLELFLKALDEANDTSGFFNVSKIKYSTYKGFGWHYRYNENGKKKTLSSAHLCVLKYYVFLNNLEWKITNEDKANKSMELEKSNYYLYDNGSGILFLDRITDKNSFLKGFWRYKFDEYVIYDINFCDLKGKVQNLKLPWIILNKNNAIKSSEINLSLNFESGIFMVKKIKHDTYHSCFQWAFIFEKSNGNYDFIKNEDLNLLKKEVLEKNFSWDIIEKNNYEESLKENQINLDLIEHFKWYYTGIDKVKKRKYDDVLQGFLWTYRYKKNYKQIELSSINLLELKTKVLNNGLDWIVLDEDMANESLRENKINFQKFGFRNFSNKTGIKYVYKSKNGSKQGFEWRYKKIINKKRYSFYSIDLRKLKQKVLDNGFDWIILDEHKANNSFKENEENIKKYKN